MKCISPTSIRDPRNEKATLLVPCGRCAWCRKRKQDEWFVRFKDESHNLPVVRFLTLTNDDAHLKSNYVNLDTGQFFRNLPDLPLGLDSHVIKSPTNDYRDLQLYFKRVRKAYLKPMKYFAVGEYGSDSERPHFHALVFGSDSFDSILVDKWNNGEVVDVPANDGSFRYVTKYLLKGSNVPPLSSPNKILCSKNPGIGKEMSEAYIRYMDINDVPVMVTGKTAVPIPRYYKRLRTLSYDKSYLEDHPDAVHHPIIASEIDSNLDLLNDSLFYGDLEMKYLERYDTLVGFDQWLRDLYDIDLKRQTKVNSKDGKRF